MQVQEIPGLGHLPYAEVWLHAVDDARWREASNAAREIGKAGLEVWTTTKTQDVADFFLARGYEEVRRYAISELDVASARDLGAPEFEIVSFADRPELADELYAIARTAYPDQFGREGTYVGEEWYEWGLRAHPPEPYLIALEDGRVLGYGYLEHEGEEWRVGFMAIARDARGRGVAGAIKRAQTAWAKEHGITSLRTANEARLVGLIALNRRIGYRPLYEEIVLRGPLAPDTEGGALHITNGDSAAGTLRETPLVERVLPWRDVLHEGPVPAVADDELRRIRAAFLAEDAPQDATTIERSLEERDRKVSANARGQYVLWFEADLYDQLQLIQVLARLAELRVDPGRITLICIGEHLGIAHFGGLGELDADQLTRVAEVAATAVSAGALDLARAAWAAFRADQPGSLGTIARSRDPVLRFLGEAFDRLSREYPSTRDGLSLTERRILAAVDEGASTAGAVFAAVGAREARPYLGDTYCFRMIARLAGARTPLLTVGARVELTAAGRRVLAGADDHVRLNGIDRWVGGVHLAGTAAAWRWNDGTEALVET